MYEPQYGQDDRVICVFYYQQLKDGFLLPKASSQSLGPKPTLFLPGSGISFSERNAALLER
jgi:hypothetical protein